MKTEFILRLASALVISFFLTACGNDNPDEPNDNPGSRIESGESEEISDPEEEPEPLSTELQPMLVDGRKWVYGHSNYSFRYSYIIDGEEEFEGIEAKRIYMSYDRENDTKYNDEFMPAREENGKVYHFNTFVTGKLPDIVINEKRWNLVYDMNLQTGDEFNTSEEKFIVESRGTIVTMGKTRRALKVKVIGIFVGRPEYDYWVEGIGSVKYQDPYWSSGDMPTMSLPFDKRLLECWEGNTKIFDYKQFNEQTYKPDC